MMAAMTTMVRMMDTIQMTTITTIQMNTIIIIQMTTIQMTIIIVMKKTTMMVAEGQWGVKQLDNSFTTSLIRIRMTTIPS